MQIPRFSNPSPTSFSAELKRRINHYFEETRQSQSGNWRLFGKAAILIVAHIALYVTVVFFTPSAGWLSLLLCVFLALATAGIGFNVMHDGSHGTFSRLPWVNRTAALTLDILGGSSYMWYYKHVVSHHTFTNIEGADDDIAISPFFRVTEQQPYYKWHRFQHIYWVVLYGTMYILWIFILDFLKYFRRRIGVVALPKMKLTDEIIFWGSKALFLALFLIIPMFTVGVVEAIIGFLVFTFFTGLVISVVFQLAHVVEETEFMVTPENGKMEDEWTVHQLKTTANFATRNWLVTWFMGGLNFQVEHHLFPKVSHIHYPKINKIVKQTCAEFGITYHEFPRVSTAIASHVRALRYWSKG
jgi:linoleoyl-CoA desaturase